MHRRNVLRCTLAGIALGTLIWVGCGDDGPTGTGGTGGTGSKTLAIPAGTYALELATWVCGDVDTTVEFGGNEVICATEIVDEFLDYPCPIKQNGNTLTMDCSITSQVSSGCSVTATIAGQGTTSGGTYAISGTVTLVATPSGCVPDECYGFRASIEKIGDAPTACQYAGEREINATITGGPFAGTRTLDASGFSDVIGNTISFQVFASYNSGTPVARTAAQGFSMNLDITTPYLDPVTLPQTLPVVAQQFGQRLLGGPEPAQLGYSEYQSEPFSSFFADSVLSGSLTVNELTADYVAGTMNVTLRGMQSDGQSSSVSTRSIVGGYFVISGFEQPAITAESAESRMTQILLETLRRSFRLSLVE